MGLFGSIRQAISSKRQAISNKRADIGDGLKTGVTRAINNFGGSWNAGGAYSNMRGSLQSFFAREMIDTKESKKSLKMMGKCSRHLAAFDEKSLSALFTRYSDNPAKFQQASGKIVQQYTKDMGLFVVEYTNFLKAVNDQLVGRARMINANNEFTELLLSSFTDVVKKTKTYIPDPMIAEAKKEVARLLLREKDESYTDAKELNKEEQGGRLSRGAARFLGAGWLAHKTKKALKKNNTIELKDMIQNVEILKKQIEDEKVDPSWLVRFNLHVKSLGKSEVFLEELAHDARVTLSIAEEDAGKVVKSAEVFISMFKNNQGMQPLVDAYQKMKTLHDDLYKSISTDKRDMNTLSDRLRDMSVELDNYFKELKSASATVKYGLGVDAAKFSTSAEMAKT